MNNTVYCSYKLAVVSPAVGADGCPLFESIPSGDSLPYAQLDTHQEDAAIVIPSLAVNQVVGIWISRSLNLDVFTALDGANETITPDEVIAILQSPTQLPAMDNAELVISW